MTMIEVDGVPMPCPSSYNWNLQDVSASDAGRTQDTVMHKNRVGQKRKISLNWAAVEWEQASKIFTAFNPEYITVRYPDFMSGKYETRQFYVGDRSAGAWVWGEWKQIVEGISFDIIEV